jgi:predicted glycoside hydrolase/deacetylase ChbG (UPF0249 family)
VVRVLDSPTCWGYGQPDAVLCEIQAQVERALADGIDVTHVDAHMGAVFHPRLLGAYVQTALQHRLPPFMLRKDYDLSTAHRFCVSFLARVYNDRVLL